MPTLKKRRMVSLPDEVDKVLAYVAKRDNMPPATKAVYLIQLALEVEEDEVWDMIALKRDTKTAKCVSHDKAWE